MFGVEEVKHRVDNYKGTYEDFIDIHKHIAWWHRWLIPELRVWNNAVLYDFLIRPDCGTDLGYLAPDIIYNFKQTEAEILNHLEQNRHDKYWQNMLKYLILGHQSETYDKYQEISLP
jgi:hypothetical protein